MTNPRGLLVVALVACAWIVAALAGCGELPQDARNREALTDCPAYSWPETAHDQWVREQCEADATFRMIGERLDGAR